MIGLDSDAIPTAHDKFKKDWIDTHQFLDDSLSVGEIYKAMYAIEKTNLFFSEMVIVHSNEDFKPIYISKNVEEILGYSQKEFLDMGSDAYFQIHALDQSDFWENLLKWENEAKRSIPKNETYLKGRGFYGGISQLCKDGSKKRFLARHESVAGKNFEVPKYNILYFEDITPFFKEGSSYWMLFQNFTDIQMHSKFYTNYEILNNIITERESEILKFIVDGKTSKEIASQLHISTETVSKHRKNMFKRTHTKDTSALIHLCKICGVI